MQTINIIDNIVDPRPRIKETSHKTLIGFLQEEYPTGFHDMPTKIYEDYREVPLKDYDLELKPDVHYTIIHQPGVTAVALGLGGYWFGWMVAAAINLAITYAVNYLLTGLFAPDLPDGIDGSVAKSSGKTSSVYNLNTGQNSIRLGQPIPVLYGRTRSYPSLVEMPYYRYHDNEQYLYQMMCVGAGKYNLDEILIGDSKESDMLPDDVHYMILKEADIIAGDIEGKIETVFSDPNYHMRVKTLPEVSGLELRGTPGTSNMFCIFEDDVITFIPHASGEYPDISSLGNGSFIQVSGSTSNDSTGEGYEVDHINLAEHKVYVKSHTFTLEPTGLGILSGWAGGYENIDPCYGNYGHQVNIIRSNDTEDCSEEALDYWNKSQVNDVYDIDIYEGRYDTFIKTVTSIKLTSKEMGVVTGNLIFMYSGTSEVIYNVQMKNTKVATSANFTFETSYGAYTLDSTPTSLDSIELDVEFPRGVYNSDTSGVFTNRKVLLEYNLTGNVESGWLNLNPDTDPQLEPDPGTDYTERNLTNTPQRRTYILPIPAGINDTQALKIRLRRDSPETEDIKSQDMAVVTAVKAIYNEPSITDYGDVTLLWVRIKATNAISSAGQTRVNTWITREDGRVSMSDVIEDIYTNTDYGAGLPATDLILPEMIAPGEDTGPFHDANNHYQYLDEDDEDTGFILTETEYYIYIPSQAYLKYFIRWDGDNVVTWGLPFYLDTWYAGFTGDPYEYMISIRPPEAEIHYEVRRRLQYSGPRYNITYDGNIVYTETSPLLVATDYVGTDEYLYNIYESSPVIDTLYDIRRYVDSEGSVGYAEFNGALDAKITVMDALKMISTAGRHTAYLDGQNIRFRLDAVQEIRHSLFNETNIIKDSLKIDYLFGEDDGTDGVLVKYRSPDDFTEQQQTYPVVATNPQVMELIGCTDQDLAAKAAQYGYKSKRSRKKIITFKTDEQGLIPNYLDRVGISHNIPKWGYGGQIVSFDGQSIFMDDDYAGDGTLAIVFRAPNGLVSDVYPCTKTSNSSVDVTGALPEWLYVGDQQDNTYFSIGELTTVVKDFMVTEVKPSGLGEFEIKGINYDPDIYTYV